MNQLVLVKQAWTLFSVSLDDIERVLDWSVRYEKDRVMITTVLHGLELYFNPCSGRVEDVTGRQGWALHSFSFRTLRFFAF